jgi:hypothetical protein
MTIQRYAVLDANSNVVNITDAEEGFELEGFTLHPDPNGRARIGGTLLGNGQYKDPSNEGQTLDLLAMVDAERDRRIDFGFQFEGKWFQADDFSAANINGASTAASIAISQGAQPDDLRWSNPNADFAWIAEDNTLLFMDAQTMIAFGLKAVAARSVIIFKARELKNQIVNGEEPDIYADASWA